jgi:hypothetical protein
MLPALAPPRLLGAVQVTMAEFAPGVAVTLVGAPGGVVTVTVFGAAVKGAVLAWVPV